MTDVVLFHHIQGLTAGVVAFADDLRAAGHTVFTPDLFGGHTFSSLEDGQEYLGTLGFTETVERGVRMAADLPSGVVYAGFSLGVMPAQQLAQTTRHCRGALLFHSCAPTSEFGAWPAGLPAQIHGMDADPFFAGEGDIEAARALAAAEENVELFVYPGSGHLFADSSLSAYDVEASDLLKQRVIAFLDSLDEAPVET